MNEETLDLLDDLDELVELTKEAKDYEIEQIRMEIVEKALLLPAPKNENDMS